MEDEVILLTYKITLDEYKQYFTDDLERIMGNKGKAEALLTQCQDDIDLFIHDNYKVAVKERYADLSNFQKGYYKKALLHQVKYRLELGDIDINNGINDMNNTKTLSIDERFNSSISAKAIKYLRNCGLSSAYAPGSGKRGIFPWGY